MGNEYQTANVYRQRFYIYRVYEPESGDVELAILADPLACDYKPALTIDLARQPTTRRWTVRVIGESNVMSSIQ
jgi:hypothetical protein